MEFLFRHRGEGKRQVKPSQDIALLEDQLAPESSDDSEYKVDSDHSSGRDGDSSSNSDANSSSGEELDDDGDGDDETTKVRQEADALKKEDHATLTTRDLLALSRAQIDSARDHMPAWLDTVKVCGCCLGEKSSDANEIVECDGCGVSVHEGCYGIRETAGSTASTVSSASTEPWFCEPCRAGLESAPPCELCPLVGGVYKRTDVGRWVHLVCALYVPGVAFADPENMTAVTVFEMNYAQWGRRVCSICSSGPDARFSRTGVCISCDAGMCKAFFHPSCAQAAGYLSEPSYVSSGSTPESPDCVMDSYLAHCKSHTDKTVVKRRRRAYLVHSAQYNVRRQAMVQRRAASRSLNGETADERILRKLSRSRVLYARDNMREPWVPTQKMPRLIGTSANAIRRLQRMGEIQGISVESQVRQEVQVMSVLEVEKKWGVAPAFNVEFVAYYGDREKRIASLKKQVANDKSLHDSLVETESSTRLRYDSAVEAAGRLSKSNADLRSKVELYRSVLALGGRTLPKAAGKAPLSAASASLTPMKASRSAHQANKLDHSHHVKTCGICQKSHDQHLLAHCDTCRLHYHLGCLTPPMARMPKKSKLYGWSCSECYPDSSSADEAKFDSERLANGRRKRVAASRALAARNDEDADNEVMQKVIRESKKTASSEAVVKQHLIDKAAAKAERKRQKKEEKARRRAERKEMKRQMKLQHDNGDNSSDDDIQVIENESGQCTVNIGPKPIKLTIKTQQSNGHAAPARVNGNSPPVHAEKRRRSSSTPKDVRTACDKCAGAGSNSDLVRCDECKRCFHFGCLLPPLKKSPKVPGYGWHCNECDPSDRDSDWHLD